MLLVCEGRVTEPNYFKELRNAARDNRYTLEIVTSKHRDPLGMVEFAKDEANTRGLNKKNGDVVWCVFDKNNNPHENIKKALSSCSSCFRIALSNPCFELWFLLHFQDQMGTIDCGETIEELRKFLPDYRKDKNVYVNLQESIWDAVKQSEKLIDYHYTNGFEPLTQCPVTFVHEIIKEVLGP